MIQLFYNKQFNRYFLFVSKNDIDLKCKHCEKTFVLGEALLVHKSFSKKEFFKHFYCPQCVNKHDKRIIDEFCIAYLTALIPEGCIIVTDKSIHISSGDISVFEAAYKESVHTEDRTVHADRESWSGAKIGVEVSLKKQNLNLDEAKALLAEMKDSTTITPEQLEHEHDDDEDAVKEIE